MYVFCYVIYLLEPWYYGNGIIGMFLEIYDLGAQNQSYAAQIYL